MRIPEFDPINKRDSVNQWWPLAAPNMVVMDSANSWVGVHSPKIMTTDNESRGIYQPGLAIAANKTYEGRIVLAGSPGVKVSVELVQGNQRSSVELAPLTPSWNKYYFTFDSKENSKNARFEIRALGKGAFSVGAVSLMPEDNIDGFRADVIQLLKDLHSGIYRWGGNMSSGYDWRDGIGDPDLRPPRYEYAWDGLENNDVGTHELIRLAELVDVKLNLTVNTGLGDAHSAAQWVAYCNESADTPMGKLRAANGHPEPFDLDLWCVGNEAYGWWQLGHTDLRNHIIKHNMFAEKMREVDPDIKLVASGASIEEMTITQSAYKLTGKIQAEYDSASDWTGGLLRHALPNIDYVSEHFYCAVDQRFDIALGKYVYIDEPLEAWTRRPANRIKAKSEHYKEYHKRIPGSEHIPVYLDEWAYFTNWVHPTPTLGVTIGYARALHEVFRHTDLIKLMGFTFATSCLSFTDTDAIYNTTGLMYKLYQSTFGTLPVEVTGNSPQPAPQWPVGGGQPKENAGAPTFPLDIVAALTADEKALTIAVINPTETDRQLNIELDNTDLPYSFKKWTMSGTSVNARNIVGQQAEVVLEETTTDRSSPIMVAAATINIYRFEL